MVPCSTCDSGGEAQGSYSFIEFESQIEAMFKLTLHLQSTNRTSLTTKVQALGATPSHLTSWSCYSRKDIYKKRVQLLHPAEGHREGGKEEQRNRYKGDECDWDLDYLAKY